MHKTPYQLFRGVRDGTRCTHFQCVEEVVKLSKLQQHPCLCIPFMTRGSLLLSCDTINYYPVWTYRGWTPGNTGNWCSPEIFADLRVFTHRFPTRFIRDSPGLFSFYTLSRIVTPTTFTQLHQSKFLGTEKKFRKKQKVVKFEFSFFMVFTHRERE